ncbi:Kelch repeat protein [Cordyceps fumosorosea ARSEF 2679]|uniref:Kelch repeat protein n=1 Tax=Cordyceps fumosorosea (strain ARSEF 2679) TaxID=1081104 RepID=A0A162IB16_CORFA|nr:Kelch repeat protein [Cordyceps fumosorosea ARSEF 2679]OAA54625.1 Kelch repeat protein [Cordyceps fumosorosea ARSEF 2679]
MSTAKWFRLISTQRLYRSSQTTTVVGQKAYIFGGELIPRQPVDNKFDVVEIFPGNNSSAQTVPAPTEAPIPRVGSASTALQGKIWIFSGRGGLEMKPVEEHGSLWCYDPRTSSWALVKPTGAPYPAGRSYHCMASNGTNKIFVHAGCPESGRLSDFWSFDIETSTWTELPSAPAPARGGASIAYNQGKVYRINGFDGKTELGGVLDVFDIASQSWASVPYTPDGVHGPEPRSVAVLLPLTIHGKAHLITMFGERDPSALGHAGAGKMLADAWVWDVTQANWHKLETDGEVPEPRGWFDADVVETGDAIVLHGGINEENKRLGDVWRLSF